MCFKIDYKNCPSELIAQSDITCYKVGFKIIHDTNQTNTQIQDLTLFNVPKRKTRSRGTCHKWQVFGGDKSKLK